MDTTIERILDAEYPPPYIIGPKQGYEHTHTIILLHGTSTSGPEFGLPLTSFPFPYPNTSSPNPSTQKATTLPDLFPGIRFVFPTGTKRKVTVLGGRETNAWFNFHFFTDRTLGEEENIPGLRDSILYISSLVQDEIEILRISLEDGREEGEEIEGEGEVGKRIIVGGFSQGCAMMGILLLSGELLEFGIAGFVGISGWLPFRRHVEEVMLKNRLVPYVKLAGLEKAVVSKAVVAYVRDLLGLVELDLEGKDGDENSKGYLDHEVWMSHGELDTKMLLQWGREMSDVLKGVGCNVVFEGREVGHWWCEATMEGLVGWLVGVWGERISEVVNGAQR